MSGVDTHEPGEASIEMDVRDLGLDTALYDTDELEFAVTPRPLLLRNTLLERARAWVGRDFAADTPEQCANFIRRLLRETGLWVAPAAKPFDIHLTGRLPQGPAFANSFFSAKNGRLLGYGDLLPGDLVAFRDTYEGDFPKGCITHVGLYVEQDLMIDRATTGQPVRRQTLDGWWKERFVIGLRPSELCSD
jgi:hypothetical protein